MVSMYSMVHKYILNNRIRSLWRYHHIMVFMMVVVVLAFAGLLGGASVNALSLKSTNMSKKTKHIAIVGAVSLVMMFVV